MKSPKYQLLRDDYNHACNELKLRNKLIEELRLEGKQKQQEIDRLNYWIQDKDRELAYFRNKSRSLEEENKRLTKLAVKFKKTYEAVEDVSCVMCNKEIDTVNEDYSTGESLGEYWCMTCAVEERESLVSKLANERLN